MRLLKLSGVTGIRWYSTFFLLFFFLLDGQIGYYYSTAIRGGIVGSYTHRPQRVSIIVYQKGITFWTGRQGQNPC